MLHGVLESTLQGAAQVFCLTYNLVSKLIPAYAWSVSFQKLAGFSPSAVAC